MESTRPINMNNAGKYVNATQEISLVLNTPFCIIRTYGKKAFEVKNYFSSEDELNSIYNPVRVPVTAEPMKRDNVVVIILESFSREFCRLVEQADQQRTIQRLYAIFRFVDY